MELVRFEACAKFSLSYFCMAESLCCSCACSGVGAGRERTGDNERGVGTIKDVATPVPVIELPVSISPSYESKSLNVNKGAGAIGNVLGKVKTHLVKEEADKVDIILTSILILFCCSGSQKQRSNRHLWSKRAVEVAFDSDSQACDCRVCNTEK